MDGRRRDQVGAVLQALADAADGGPDLQWDVAEDPDRFAWLGMLPPTHVLPPPPPPPAPPLARPNPMRRPGWPELFALAAAAAAPVVVPPPPTRPGIVLWDDDDLRRLASLDALHRHLRVVREGWIFLSGTVEVAGRPTRACLPLLSRPVRLTWAADRFVFTPAGDLELHPVVPRGAVAQRLEEHLPIDGTHLAAWCAMAIDEAGLAAAAVVDTDEDPSERVADELVVIPGCGLFLDRSVAGLDVAPTLRSWAAADGIEDTALAALYGLGTPLRVGPPGGGAVGMAAPAVPTAAVPTAAASTADDPVWSPFPMTEQQRAVVRRARVAPITVVSGSPGTGKSHTVVATAVDRVDQHRSVLVATASDHATEVLAELLDRRPGPTPVLFGNAEQRERLAAQLTTLVSLGGSHDEVAAQARTARGAADWDHRLEQHIAALVEAERVAAGFAGLDALLHQAATEAPGLVDPAVDFALVEDLYRHAGTDDLDRPDRHEREAARTLRELLGMDEDAPLRPLEPLLAAVRARHGRAELESRGGTVIGSLWDDLTRADAELELAVGALVSDKARLEDLRADGGRTAVAELASILRADRGERRRHLRELGGRDLLRALPLWVGTVRDIDDLLPAVPGLFDLVILDEAAQIDQSRAASTLLRGRRALVVGDPSQLVLDPADADAFDLRDALAAAGHRSAVRHIDLRRESVFDVAAGDAPTVVLDEHFRSTPHLVGFAVEDLGAPAVRLATRHPANECRDDIDTVHVDGPGLDEHGVNAAEVQAVRLIVADAAASGATSVGVVAPIPTQADALEAMLLDTMLPQDVRRLGLRVGTVEALQGAERDLVIASFGVGERDDPAWFAQVEDPHRFNVMITRARERMVVVTSLSPGNRGLARRFLAYAEQGLDPVPSIESPDPWVRGLRDELVRMGMTVRTGYPVGRWSVDLVVGEGDAAVAVEAIPHPDGPIAHIERHRLLVRMGWRVLDAFPTRWEGNPVPAAIDLVTDLAAETTR